MRVQFHLETGRRHGPHIVGLRHYFRKILARFGGVRLRKIGGGNFVVQPGLFCSIIGKRLLAGDQILAIDLVALAGAL